MTNFSGTLTDDAGNKFNVTFSAQPVTEPTPIPDVPPITSVGVPAYFLVNNDPAVKYALFI